MGLPEWKEPPLTRGQALIRSVRAAELGNLDRAPGVSRPPEVRGVRCAAIAGPAMPLGTNAGDCSVTTERAMACEAHRVLVQSGYDGVFVPPFVPGFGTTDKGFEGTPSLWCAYYRQYASYCTARVQTERVDRHEREYTTPEPMVRPIDTVEYASPGKGNLGPGYCYLEMGVGFYLPELVKLGAYPTMRELLMSPRKFFKNLTNYQVTEGSSQLRHISLKAGAVKKGAVSACRFFSYAAAQNGTTPWPKASLGHCMLEGHLGRRIVGTETTQRGTTVGGDIVYLEGHPVDMPDGTYIMCDSMLLESLTRRYPRCRVVADDDPLYVDDLVYYPRPRSGGTHIDFSTKAWRSLVVVQLPGCEVRNYCLAPVDGHPADIADIKVGGAKLEQAHYLQVVHDEYHDVIVQRLGTNPTVEQLLNMPVKWFRSRAGFGVRNRSYGLCAIVSDATGLPSVPFDRFLTAVADMYDTWSSGSLASSYVHGGLGRALRGQGVFVGTRLDTIVLDTLPASLPGNTLLVCESAVVRHRLAVAYPHCRVREKYKREDGPDAVYVDSDRRAGVEASGVFLVSRSLVWIALDYRSVPQSIIERNQDIVRVSCVQPLSTRFVTGIGSRVEDSPFCPDYDDTLLQAGYTLWHGDGMMSAFPVDLG